MYRILSINPGSTSTKVAVYEDEKELFCRSVTHDSDKLRSFKFIEDQLPFRLDCVREILSQQGFSETELSAVVGRGGLFPDMKTGGYAVTDDMLEMIRSGRASPHASNLGALLADAVARPLGIPAYIYDPVSADELTEVSRVVGFKGMHRHSFCHVLNTRATAMKHAQSLGRRYEDMRYLIAHLGGGISISAHKYGRIVDIIADDSGPFSPERAGSMPLLDVVELCYSGKYTKREMLTLLRGEGGMKALLGTSDCREIEKRIETGDEYAALVYDAQAYQIAKGVGNLVPALEGNIDYIILTGGLAYSERLTQRVKYYLGEKLAPIAIMPGENEMEALSLGTLRILKGEERVRNDPAGHGE